MNERVIEKQENTPITITYPDGSTKQGIIIRERVTTSLLDVTTERYWSEHQKREYIDGLTETELRVVLK